MAAIEQITLCPEWRVHNLWLDVVRQTSAWLLRQRLPARDTVLLLPFSALLAPARTAFAEVGGWQPRVETVLTLTASLTPPVAPLAGHCSGDAVQDRLCASALLTALPWGEGWAQRDARGLQHMVNNLVETAQTLRSAALARAPGDRPAFWAQARAEAARDGGPAQAEALLLRVALEWAASSVAALPPAVDAGFSFPATAWVLVELGGSDAAAQAMAAASGAPTLVLRLDAALPSWAEDETEKVLRWPAHDDVERLVCEDFESEAQAAASTVIEALNAGRLPVALVAQDRALVRRIRALLERAQVPVIDETGWLLATTRSGAALMMLLRAALPGAPQDAWLDWLKAWPGVPATALDSLEAQWRGQRRVRDAKAAQALWDSAAARLAPLQTGRQQTLADWLDLLGRVLQGDGSWHILSADMAGQQLLAALRLTAPGLSAPPDEAWRGAVAGVAVTLAGFVDWVAATLEQLPFLPTPDAGAQVVLTPLLRTMGRAFGHIVLPGTDDKNLSAGDAQPSLIPAAMTTALALPDRKRRQRQQRLALLHLLRSGRVTLLRRERDEGEPLSESPDLAWLMGLLQASASRPPPSGLSLDTSSDTSPGTSPGTSPDTLGPTRAELWPPQRWQPQRQRVPFEAQARPLPSAGAALPTVLSASQLEALRQCPYRFFARALLRLQEPEEIDGGLAKRDYGTWLHAVLHQFHSERDHQADAALQMHQAADAAAASLALDGAELLPFRASFMHFVPAYLRWLAAREAQGWHWADGESEHRFKHPDIAGLELRGRIDRLDHGPEGQRQLLDYKTGSLQALQQKVKTPLEDTQLAFYAALLGQSDGADEGLRATYLSLDDADAPREIEHPQVAQTVSVMLQGLAADWQRLRDGAPMPALGEGAVCQTCEVRGLCRRDHWLGAAAI